MKRASLVILVPVLACLIVLTGCDVITSADPGDTLPAGHPVV